MKLKREAKVWTQTNPTKGEWVCVLPYVLRYLLLAASMAYITYYFK